MSQFLNVAVEAARKAGELLVARLQAQREICAKGKRDIVTDADLAAEEAILSLLQERFPSHAIYSEERPFLKGTTSYTWFVDPLDGTANYSRRFPCFSTSIALSLEGQVILGVVYEPLSDRLFWAEKGKGAYLNNSPLRVSKVSRLPQAVVGLDWGRRPEVRRRLCRVMDRLTSQIGTLRTMGSASLGFCFVAAGWTDAYFHFSLKPWDLAAGAFIVEEAGGEVTDVHGRPWTVEMESLLATNSLLHQALLSLLSLPQASEQDTPSCRR